MTIDRRRPGSFTPEALHNYARLFEGVWNELVEEGLVGACENSRSYRNLLAESVFRLAQAPWTDMQMRQLLVRGFRNEAARRQRSL